MYIMSIKIIIIKGSKQTTAPLLFKDEVVELKETYLVGGTSRGIAQTRILLGDRKWELLPAAL